MSVKHWADEAGCFFPLRLRDTGMIKSRPHKILVPEAHWRFLRKLRGELNGEMNSGGQ
jgi:hypothetical protein